MLLKELRSELRLGIEQIENGLSEEFTDKTMKKIKSLGSKKLKK